MHKLPILFLHGNGDSAAVWLTTLWRFESNDYDKSLLHTLDLPYPSARDEDGTPQPGRSSIAEYTQALAEKAACILRDSGESKLIMVGNSRGGYPIRSYLKYGDGHDTVAKVVLGGTPNHGVWASDINPGNEFNGQGTLLHDLNIADKNGDETTVGVRFLTLRSDHFDKYAQPSGQWIGQGQMPTNVGYDGPALHGACNLILAGRDHRELSFHPDAFLASYRFITGHAPARIDIVPEVEVVLDGRMCALLSAPQGDEATNLPLAGARLTIFEVDAASGDRVALRHEKTVAVDGQWGPFCASPSAFYEFVIAADGYAITHIYRSPFPRSSDVVHLRPVRAPHDAHGSVITMTRPRGYFGVGRDAISLDGQSPPPGLPDGFPALSESCLSLDEAERRSVVAECNGERIAVQSWPAQEGHLVFAELHY